MVAIAREYLCYDRTYYADQAGEPSGEADRIKIALRPIIWHCPSLPAEHFRPPALKEHREWLIDAVAPDEAETWRHPVAQVNRGTPVQPSQQDRCKPDPEKFVGDRYDANSYRHAIEYAVAAANRTVAKVAETEGREVNENDLIPHWHLHQMRHTAATIIRRETGLDAARAILGHRSLDITDTYAELDQGLAVATAKKLG